jgi:hypothetical protein
VVAVVVGPIANSQEAENPGGRPQATWPRDPWLSEVAVALAELGLTDFARNTGRQLGGAPMEGEIGLQADLFLVCVNLFAHNALAHQA